MTTEQILAERGTTHGDFSDNSRVSQQLKEVINNNLDFIRDYRNGLTDVEAEAIDMICHKLARIVCGNSHFKDHWADIAGYAQLVVERLDK